jgi:hypothetical protein
MAYQNGYGHPPGYGPGYAYPPTQQYPAHPDYPGYPPPPDAYGPGPYGPPPPPPAPPRAPVGVHIVAIMQYLTGIVLVLAAVAIGIVTFNEGRIGDTELPESVRGAVTGAGIAIAALALVAGLIAISIGRRVHRGKQWARVLVLILSALSLATNVYALVTTGAADPLTGLVLPILYLYLLNTRPAREWFRYRRF